MGVYKRIKNAPKKRRSEKAPAYRYGTPRQDSKKEYKMWYNSDLWLDDPRRRS
jgi:hypothetical protein